MPLFGPPDVDKMKAKRDAAGLFKLVIAKGENGDQARQALIDIGPEAVLPLAREVQLSKGSPRPLVEFLDVVSAMGPAAVPALVKTMDLGVPATYLATLVVGAIGGGEATACLERLAAADDKQVCRTIRSLATGFIKDPPGMQKRLPILLSMQAIYLYIGQLSFAIFDRLDGAVGMATKLEMLRQVRDNFPATEWAAGVLGIAGDRAAIPALLRLAEERNPTHQWIGVMALGLMGDPAAIDPLNKKIAEGSAVVSQAAQLALAAIQREIAASNNS